jgi:hypothetical protein
MIQRQFSQDIQVNIAYHRTLDVVTGITGTREDLGEQESLYLGNVYVGST